MISMREQSILSLLTSMTLSSNFLTQLTTQKQSRNHWQKNYLSAKIQSINPYGLIIIKFFETLDTPLFTNNASLKYNSTNIEVRLKPFQD
jgi:hypothetical protein